MAVVSRLLTRGAVLQKDIVYEVPEDAPYNEKIIKFLNSKGVQTTGNKDTMPVTGEEAAEALRFTCYLGDITVLSRLLAKGAVLDKDFVYAVDPTGPNRGADCRSGLPARTNVTHLPGTTSVVVKPGHPDLAPDQNAR